MAIPERLKQWKEHLDSYRKAHPDKSLKTCMKEASETYRKSKSTKEKSPE